MKELLYIVHWGAKKEPLRALTLGSAILLFFKSDPVVLDVLYSTFPKIKAEVPKRVSADLN